MSDRLQTIRDSWANQHAQAYQAQETEVQSFQANPAMSLDLSDEKVRSTVPQSVLEAYDYYLNQISDWGSVAVAQEKIQNQDIYAVTVSTDGDDGWAELFDTEGQELGAARTLCEKVAWGEMNTVRSYTKNSELPSELQAKADEQNV
ncbi:hypothetical protein [Leptolyngbya sp. NIES-2104]|uniref:hypothetical protein n=1 Tax=Leptolyngbya sp. NIES-2104 TaxID=1552121 RepID=UPI0006EC50B6|nr:hypothetical protein [Leptolyngbya sp. NIES-2104]GAP97485.1 hypothetical protein NIES2104_40320 [Leptolyngbya sp. NIES-2104]